MEDATDTIRYPRTLTATDTEWRRIRERADAAGIPISRFICQRAAGPEPRPRAGVSPEAMLARLENIETAVLALAEVERQRLPGTRPSSTSMNRRRLTRCGRPSAFAPPPCQRLAVRCASSLRTRYS